VNLNQQIDVAEQLPRTQQQASMAQDNANKTNFALRMIERLPQEPAKDQQPPKIPSMGAMAVPN
jgi:hypothetical protein